VIVERQSWREIILVAAGPALGGQAVIIPPHAESGGQLRRDLPFILDVERQLRLSGAKCLRTQFHCIVEHRGIERQHVTGGKRETLVRKRRQFCWIKLHGEIAIGIASA